MGRRLAVVVCAVACAALGLPGVALADGWLPHPADAEWTYEWTDSVYATTPTKEKVTVKEIKGSSFTLAWTSQGLENPGDAVNTVGTVTFQESSAGLINTDWSSNPPPASFPVLCARVAGCPNALSSTYYNLIWGSRAPVLAAPVLKGLTWEAAGGASGEVSGSSVYLGTESVTVPAFTDPVIAAKIETQITQAGALGDPYGSGVRTTWWVYGVGPVKVEFQHAGGADAPITTSTLLSTNQKPQFPPSDANFFPLEKGKKWRYRWTNTKHMKNASVQDVVIDQTATNSARFTVQHVDGPIRVTASYGFAVRGDGITNLWGASKAATLSPLPPLGPASRPKAQRRHFFTPLDLMIYGMNPVLSAYPGAGQSWSVKTPSRDYSVFGVLGTTTVIGLQTVKVPAGRFQALVVRSTLAQAGFPFGSGTRTSYFAADKGLVKLVFKHKDGSTSTVELLR